MNGHRRVEPAIDVRPEDQCPAEDQQRSPTADDEQQCGRPRERKRAGPRAGQLAERSPYPPHDQVAECPLALGVKECVEYVAPGERDESEAKRADRDGGQRGHERPN